MVEEVTMHSQVLMHYSIRLVDGTPIESSYDEEPIEIKMGSGDVREGMELALLGLRRGDEQTLTLSAEQAFGTREEDNVHDMPRSDFPEELKPEAGVSYTFESVNGDEIPGTVLEVADDILKVDFNHPLAGHEIVFKVSIMAVENSAA